LRGIIGHKRGRSGKHFWARRASPRLKLPAPTMQFGVLQALPHPAVLEPFRGPIYAGPLDDESAGESRQRQIKQAVTVTGAFQTRVTPATHGSSLSRASRKPQIESVKKSVGIESFESICGYFARVSRFSLSKSVHLPPHCFAACSARAMAWSQSAWRGAFLVWLHSSSISGATRASSSYCSAVPMSAASSTRWPFGSKK